MATGKHNLMSPKHNPFNKSPRSKAKANADKWFARFIRLRGTELKPNGKRYGLCVTSNRLKHISGLDCGHAHSRRHDAIRWDERNAYCQSKRDNRFRQGEQFLMLRHVDKVCGDGISNELYRLSKISRPFEIYEIEAIAQNYKQKCALLLGVENMTEKVWSEIISHNPKPKSIAMRNIRIRK